MSYWTIEPETRAAKIGQKIYADALYDRKGFHEALDDIDDEIWLDIFEDMGMTAIQALHDNPVD